MLFSTYLIVAAAAFSTNPANADFVSRRERLPETLFEVFDTQLLSDDEREAMEFMYAYMPLPDIAGHDADFHLANVRATLKARREMPWGASVPEREFHHFVLPVRVNNEALDLSRPRIYDMLADRVKGLSMKEAILEVNHWCHEHVTYKPSDARTSPPLSAMSQAIGRCGEESTFTVAALRAVGIPARQVYTPRWAHTDDNHAWVEAWADGQWYFLGACEPAPILDMAWFNAPASRGVLMTTNVFGRYDGPEEKLYSEPLNTTINVTQKYAPVKELNVRVVDSEGKPVEGAKTIFSIFNYSEFYPAVVKSTDSEGKASLTSGLGDVIVWATDGSRFGFAIGNPKDEKELDVILDKDKNYTGSFDIKITPPFGSGVLPSPSADEVERNNIRTQHEDSIRAAYEATFLTAEDATQLAKQLNVDQDALVKIITEARGNSRIIAELLPTLDAEKRHAAIKLLGAVTEKDRRDIPISVILDNINFGKHDLDNEVYVDYVLSPRIENESLVAFKNNMANRFGVKTLSEFRDNPDLLINWVSDSIAIETISNPQLVRIDPATVMNVRKADPRSRNIFFVALARTAGIPARIDPVTSKVQIIPGSSDEWTDVRFKENQPEQADNNAATAKGKLTLSYSKVGRNENPHYYTQFTLSKINDGSLSLLEYPEEYGWKELCDNNEPLDAGQYLLLTGQRMADGSVLAHGEIFTLAGNAEIDVPLILREDPDNVQVIGSLNAENIYKPLSGKSERSILSTTGRGYYVLGIIQPGHEPSAHALNDLSAVSEDLEKWGRSILVLFTDEDSASRFNRDHFGSLPANLAFGIDSDSRSLNELKESLNMPTTGLPVFVIADSFNRVVFATQGYNIGLGDKLLDILSKLRE